MSHNSRRIRSPYIELRRPNNDTRAMKVNSEMVENCGHAPHLEAQPVTLELMSNFVAQIK